MEQVKMFAKNGGVFMIRQGDVLMEKVDLLPESKKLERKWLFEGKATRRGPRSRSAINVARSSLTWRRNYE